MKTNTFITACLLFFAFHAHAQFSIVETDSGNRLRVLGRDFNLNFFSFAGIETDKFSNEGGRISTYNYLTFATYWSNYRFSMRLPFQYSTAGTDRFNKSRVNNQELFLQDVIVGMQKYDPVFLPWDIESYWEGRVYLPTSRHSKKTGLIGKLRNTINISKVFSPRFELEYANNYSYFVQSRTAYRNIFMDEDGYEVDVASATKQMDLDHWVTLWSKVSPTTGLGLQFGQEIAWWNASEVNRRDNRRQRQLKLGPSLRFPISKSANFIFSYTDTVDQDKNTAELGQFLASNTQFSLLSFLRF